MWRFLESGYRDLSADDKALAKKELGPAGKRVRFDGKYENEHLGIAGFMLDHLDRFGSFKGRDLDSHCPSVETFRRMLTVFAPIRASLVDRDISAADIVSVLLERGHPTRRRGRPSIDA